jgi:hypothetical protein
VRPARPTAAAAKPAAPRAAAPARKGLSLAGGAASVLGAAIGIFASREFGAMLLFPGLFAFAAMAVLVKVGPAQARPFVGALSAVAGHAGWMAVGAIMAGAFAPVAIDLVLMVGLGAWLVARPGLVPAFALATFELLVGAVNAWQLTSPIPPEAAKALWLHLLLRLLALAGLAFGYVAMRTARESAAQADLARTFE